jgi:hypothetical protein
VCGHCAQRSAQAVAELPLIYVALHGALSGGSSDDGPRVDVSPDPSVPIALSVYSVMEELETWAIEAGDLVRGQLELSMPARMQRRSVRFSHATVTLRRQWPAAVGTMIAVELVRGVFRQRGRAYRTLGWDTLIHALHAPCPTCGLMTLARWDGDDYVACRSCHNTWTEDDYTRLTIILADEARRTGVA